MGIISISKEKNIVTVVTDKITRKYDINSGSWFGKNDKQVKKCGIPRNAFVNYKFGKNDNIDFETLFSVAMCCYLNGFSFNHKTIILLDRVISFLNTTNKLDTNSQYTLKRIFNYSANDLDLFLKDFSKIMKFYNYEVPFSLDSYKNKENISFLKSIINFSLTEYNYTDIVNNVSKEYYRPLATYINRGAMVCMSLFEIIELFNKAKMLGVTEFSKDFCYDYFKITTAYELHENEIVNKTISERQSFSLNNIENVTFEIPTSIEDFVRLGNEFGNCLGGHELNVFIKTSRRRVVILRNENWKIACDFENDGTITQFLLPHNRYITSSEYYYELTKIKSTLQENLFELFG